MIILNKNIEIKKISHYEYHTIINQIEMDNFNVEKKIFKLWSVYTSKRQALENLENDIKQMKNCGYQENMEYKK